MTDHAFPAWVGLVWGVLGLLWLVGTVFWILKIVEVARIPEPQYRAAGPTRRRGW